MSCRDEVIRSRLPPVPAWRGKRPADHLRAARVALITRDGITLTTRPPTSQLLAAHHLRVSECRFYSPFDTLSAF